MHLMRVLFSPFQLLASILFLGWHFALAWLAYVGFWCVHWSCEGLMFWDTRNTAFGEWIIVFIHNGIAKGDELKAMGATWRCELHYAIRCCGLQIFKLVYAANEWIVQRIARHFRPCQGRCKSHEQRIPIA